MAKSFPSLEEITPSFPSLTPQDLPPRTDSLCCLFEAFHDPLRSLLIASLALLLIVLEVLLWTASGLVVLDSKDAAPMVVVLEPFFVTPPILLFSDLHIGLLLLNTSVLLLLNSEIDLLRRWIASGLVVLDSDDVVQTLAVLKSFFIIASILVFPNSHIDLLLLNASILLILNSEIDLLRRWIASGLVVLDSDDMVFALLILVELFSVIASILLFLNLLIDVLLLNASILLLLNSDMDLLCRGSDSEIDLFPWWSSGRVKGIYMNEWMRLEVKNNHMNNKKSMSLQDIHNLLKVLYNPLKDI